MTSAQTPRLKSDGRLQLYLQKDLEQNPSRADGISLTEETRLRSTACSFIARAGKDLQFKQLAIATACVYFHTFFVRFSFKSYDRFEIAAVCLFLAGKVEEQRRKVKDITEVCLMVRNGKKKIESTVLQPMCESILDKELLLLSVIEFNFHPAHPYQYCMMILKRIFQTSESGSPFASEGHSCNVGLSKLIQKEIAQFAWLMINDSLKTTLCLMYRPEPIALSCIDAAIRIMNLDRAEMITFPTDWFVEHVPSMNRDQCYHIWSVLMQVVELESSIHTGDSEILWGKFRKVVANCEVAAKASNWSKTVTVNGADAGSSLALNPTQEVSEDARRDSGDTAVPVGEAVVVEESGRDGLRDPTAVADGPVIQTKPPYSHDIPHAKEDTDYTIDGSAHIIEPEPYRKRIRTE